MDASEWNDRYAKARADGGDRLWAPAPSQALQRIVEELPPGTALDLATGDGRNALWLARRGWRVTAVDFSSEGLDLARAQAGEAPIDWRLGDVLDWEPEGRFDLVTMTYLHLPGTANSTAVRRASRWLVPGGTLVVLGHDKDNLTRGAGDPQDPDVLYSAALLRHAAEGLQVRTAEQLIRNPAVDPEGPAEAGRAVIDTLLHAVRPAGSDVQPGRAPTGVSTNRRER